MGQQVLLFCQSSKNTRRSSDQFFSSSKNQLILQNHLRFCGGGPDHDQTLVEPVVLHPGQSSVFALCEYTKLGRTSRFCRSICNGGLYPPHHFCCDDGLALLRDPLLRLRHHFDRQVPLLGGMLICLFPTLAWLSPSFRLFVGQGAVASPSYC